MTRAGVPVAADLRFGAIFELHRDLLQRGQGLSPVEGGNGEQATGSFKLACDQLDGGDGWGAHRVASGPPPRWPEFRGHRAAASDSNCSANLWASGLAHVPTFRQLCAVDRFQSAAPGARRASPNGGNGRCTTEAADLSRSDYGLAAGRTFRHVHPFVRKKSAKPIRDGSDLESPAASLSSATVHPGGRLSR